MELDRARARTTSQAPESTFTGDVQIGGYFRRDAPSRLAGATAVFEPGSRTPWKTNSMGQTVVVITGTGRAQSQGGEVVEIRAGDVLWFAPEERHWEGAAPDHAMTYFATHEGSVEFGDAVSDGEYGG